MTRALTSRGDRWDFRLLDEEAWEAPRRLTDLELFTHGSGGWRRAGCDLDDQEDCR